MFPVRQFGSGLAQTAGKERMDPLRHLIATDHREALQFFFTSLRDVTADEQIDSPALLYNASVLAHFASTSTFGADGMPVLHGLSELFDRFVADWSLRHDSDAMEWAAAQCLLFTGFFGDQLQRRHNLDWYGQLGADFYDRAATSTQEASRRRMMERMAGEFQDWRRRYLKLARELRDYPYILFG
jgi:hypothetical protein